MLRAPEPVVGPLEAPLLHWVSSEHAPLTKSDGATVAIDTSLDGVVVASTALAHVDGKRGVALVRGYPLADLAARGPYEDVAHLVLAGELPAGAERARFTGLLRAHCGLTEAEARAAALLAEGRAPADALAGAIALCENSEARETEDPLERTARVLARVPSVCAAVSGAGAPPAEWSYARRALAAMKGTRDDAPAVRALDVLLCLEAEHGLSASTFACRVAASSGANAGPSLAAAVATLSGPRHGGATANARKLLLRAHEAGDVAAFVRDAHAKRERLPGFGHRIYKVPDPRVPPMRAAMHEMGGVRLLPVAEALDREAAALYGAKGVHANIDLYGAALLDALGVEPSQYVAAFALGLASGWLAHWLEQRATGRLVRPESEYTGPEARAVPRH